MKPIETDRLILRNFRREDAAGLLAYLESPVASCFLSLTLRDMDAALAEADRRGADDAQIAVCLKDSDQLIGDLFAHPEDDTVSVGWNFNPAFSGRGYAFEAAHALFTDLFEVQGIRRLYAYVADHNLPSQKLCEQLGMRREGLFLDYISFRNDDAGQPIYENTMQYALLRREWDALCTRNSKG
ncbi:GNAT family N-acetyltransferase [Rhodovulum tesquicola]|uniref:RimJ/RimL family protein N-acetyltransferase n=1 Tax=Rhodovulum steppense TaxID=540251 RepID=A0A4R1YX43_9RHOB|nr:MULTISPECIES: GNAT family protein [Rhodovulum]MCO8146457.1 GNAT family N-acetyltransferase [Rhodovulum tesquicola]TCM85567.1 RimJ/RimL family protein N-acetyltransferase [Rhodovulum steppense]